MIFPSQISDPNVANLYILEVESGTFENQDTAIKIEYIYKNMARVLSGGADGYVPVGTAFGNVDSDSLNEVVIAGRKIGSAGAGLGFLEVQGVDTYKPGSIIHVADFDAFVVKAKPLIIKVNGSPVIYLQGRDFPSKIWIVNNIINDQFVDQSNIKEVFNNVGVLGIWDWGDQDHGLRNDGFDIYISTLNQILDIEYKGSGNPANASSYKIDTLAFDLNEFFDVRDSFFNEIFSYPGMDIDRDGKREIVASLKGSHLDVLNGKPFTQNTFNVFVFEWKGTAIRDDVQPTILHTPVMIANAGQNQIISTILKDDVSVQTARLFYRLFFGSRSRR
jgi:hypothetical protein